MKIKKSEEEEEVGRLNDAQVFLSLFRSTSAEKTKNGRDL